MSVKIYFVVVVFVVVVVVESTGTLTGLLTGPGSQQDSAVVLMTPLGHEDTVHAIRKLTVVPEGRWQRSDHRPFIPEGHSQALRHVMNQML